MRAPVAALPWPASHKAQCGGAIRPVRLGSVPVVTFFAIY
jgi:hypothetical protein